MREWEGEAWGGEGDKERSAESKIKANLAFLALSPANSAQKPTHSSSVEWAKQDTS